MQTYCGSCNVSGLSCITTVCLVIEGRHANILPAAVTWTHGSGQSCTTAVCLVHGASCKLADTAESKT